MGYRLNFWRFLPISTIINQKKQFRPVCRYFLQNSISIVSWEKMCVLHSLASIQAIHWKLVVSYEFQHNSMQRCGFVLFSDRFCNSLFLAWVEKDLAHLTLWPNMTERMGYRLAFFGFLIIWTQINEKRRFGAFHFMAKFLKKHMVWTGFYRVFFNFNLDQLYNVVLVPL